MTEELAARVEQAAEVGMATAIWADLQPDRVAVIDAAGASRTWREFNANANRVARLLRAARLPQGAGIALLCDNRCEFLEVLYGALRGGFRVTPINLRLTPPEISYIIDNCEARALFTTASPETVARLPPLDLQVAIDAHLPDFEDYGLALKSFDGRDIRTPRRGSIMLYTSGTTGRPKGVLSPGGSGPRFDPTYERESDRHLCVGPAYHAAPLFSDIRTPVLNGVTTRLLDKWDSVDVLETIAAERVSHTHMVPIMFQRLLALPAETRARYDVSSLKRVTHGAAPCPPDVKRAMIAWFGPVLREYYAGSEGGAGIAITSAEWLAKPGSVGRRPTPDSVMILDNEGKPCPAGVAGHVFLKLPPGGFTYFKAPDKTLASQREGYFTMGDIGYLDEDDYLFLTGRSAETIISGGVNIYPQEVDNAISTHPAVADVCTVGVPNAEWGEEVRSLVQLRPGRAPSPDLAEELLRHARTTLAAFKAPRQIDFVSELPRTETGKVLRSQVRAGFWQNPERQI